MICLEYIFRLATCHGQTFKELGYSYLRYRSINRHLNKIIIFVLSPFNLIDLLVFFGLTFGYIFSKLPELGSGMFVNLLVLLRLFKLVSYTKGFWIFYYVLIDSAIYLFYVNIFLFITVIIIGGFVYYAEMHFETFFFF